MRSRFRRNHLVLLTALLVGACAGDSGAVSTRSISSKHFDDPAPCCDLAERPPSIEGSHCCADGTWKLDTGSGGSEECIPLGGDGSICPLPQVCCDPAEDPGGIEGSHCCADGSWIFDTGSGGSEECDAHGGDGEICGGCGD